MEKRTHEIIWAWRFFSPRWSSLLGPTASSMVCSVGFFSYSSDISARTRVFNRGIGVERGMRKPLLGTRDDFTTGVWRGSLKRDREHLAGRRKTNK